MCLKGGGLGRHCDDKSGFDDDDDNAGGGFFVEKLHCEYLTSFFNFII